MKTVLITGISSGIGYATAEKFLKLGYRVIGSVRDEASIEKLAVRYKNNLHIWKVDLSQIERVNSIKDFLKLAQIETVDILINNAGIAESGPFQFQDFSRIEYTFNVNVLSLMKLTQVIIPFLIPTKGRIINISSLSGVNGTPFLAGYCASKHAVEGFSESLRRELKIYGIEVLVIGPGSVKTPIWTKGFQNLKKEYEHTIYSKSYLNFLKFAEEENKKALPVEVIVQNILHAAISMTPQIRYSPIPRKMRNWYITKLMTKKFYERVVCKSLGLIP